MNRRKTRWGTLAEKKQGKHNGNNVIFLRKEITIVLGYNIFPARRIEMIFLVYLALGRLTTVSSPRHILRKT